MNALTKTKQTIEATGNQLLAAIDESMSQIKQLETIESAKQVHDEIKDFDLLLKTQRVQEALGDKLNEAKQKIAQLTIDIKLQISKLAQNSADNTMKERAYERAGIRRDEIKHIEEASKMPEKQREVYLAAKANEGTLPNIREVARIQRLPDREKSRAFATIEDVAKRPSGEHPKFTQTVSSAIKNVEAKIAKDWTPKSPGPPVEAFKPKLPDTYYPAMQILSIGNQLHNKITPIMVCARRFTEPSKSESETLINKKELGELLDSFESKLSEIADVSKELASNVRKLIA